MISCVMFRHGETEWNVENKIQGSTDIPLNENGIFQAKLLATKLSLHDFDFFYSSPLSRALKTAEIIRGRFPSTILTSGLLKEIDFGEAEGMDRLEMRQRYKSLFCDIIDNPKHPLCNDTAFKGGETKREAFERLLSFLNKIDKEHPNKKIAISTHGVMLSLIPLFIENKKISFPNATHIEFDFCSKNCSLYNIVYKSEV